MIREDYKKAAQRAPNLRCRNVWQAKSNVVVRERGGRSERVSEWGWRWGGEDGTKAIPIMGKVFLKKTTTQQVIDKHLRSPLVPSIPISFAAIDFSSTNEGNSRSRREKRKISLNCYRCFDFSLRPRTRLFRFFCFYGLRRRGCSLPCKPSHRRRHFREKKKRSRAKFFSSLEEFKGKSSY